MRESRVVVCAGSGGVGKTTIAAAIGVRAAQLGRRALVLTVDPAKRLATSLGLELTEVEDKKVEGLSDVSGSLSAAMIDSKRVFDGFVLKHANEAQLVARIMKNRLYQQLSTTLSGSQEFTALERLLQALEKPIDKGGYDLVVLDTPPTKHAMDFLTAPQRINALFQDGVTRWFMSPSEKPTGFFAGLVSRGTRVALKSLEILTGAQFIEELLDFFSAIKTIQSVLRERSDAAHRLLTSNATQFVVVTSFDAAKLLEARFLEGELSRLGYSLKGVVINRSFPKGLPQEFTSSASLDPEQKKIVDFYSRFRSYYSYRYGLYEKFSQSLSPKVAIVRIPEYQRDVHGLADLKALAAILASTSQPSEPS